MRVLVTGATGFVGQALMDRLAAAGHETFPIARRRTDNPLWIQWDLGSEPAPAALPERVDAVVHAAQSRLSGSLPKDGPDMFAVNAASTAALLNYAARAGASRFCLLSSGTVYEPFDRGLDEGAPLAPTSILGATKLAAEIIARPYAANFPVSVLRIFTPYGPGQTARLIPGLIERVRAGTPVKVSSDGEGMRLAPVYVDDLCAIVVAALDACWTGAVNIAAPQATTLRRLVGIIGYCVGRPPLLEIGTGSAINLAPPVEKLASRFDLKTLIPLQDGLSRAVAASRSAR